MTNHLTTTKDACTRLGVSRAWFNKHVTETGVEPEMRLPGRTGAQLWNDDALTTVAEAMGRELGPPIAS